MTKMATTPIYGTNPLKIFFPGTSGSNSKKLGMLHLVLRLIIVYSNDDPRLKLTCFYGNNVKFRNLSFSVGKNENRFFRNIAACDLKVGRCRQLFEVMKMCEYSRSRLVRVLGSRSFAYEHENLLFSETTGSFSTKSICMYAFRLKEMKIN